MLNIIPPIQISAVHSIFDVKPRNEISNGMPFRKASVDVQSFQTYSTFAENRDMSRF